MNYNKQRNLCVSLIRKEKKNFFHNINLSDISDNKKFWKTVKPFFTEKTQCKNKISLIEKPNEWDIENVDFTERVISEDLEVAEVFNEFFVNIVPNLDIPTVTYFGKDFVETDDSVTNAINKFSNHPSIKMIKSEIKSSELFSFTNVIFDDVFKKVNDLNVTVSSQRTDIPTKVLKENSRFFAKYFSDNINHCIECSNFPNLLKSAEVVPVHKKKSKNSKDNFSPVSILSNISYIYERSFYE